MKKELVALPILLILALLESVFPSLYLVLVFSLLFVVFGNKRLAALSAFGGGLMMDFLGSLQFGLCAFLAVLLVSLSLIASNLIARGSRVVTFLILIATVAVFSALISFPRISLPYGFGVIMLKNGIIALLLFPLARWVNAFSKEGTV